MMFLYEMHLHTYPTSGGGAPIEEHIPVLMERGYQGCVITNHFYNGDTRVHRALPWRDFIRPYIEDYERAKKFAEHLDFDVLFGIEEQVGGGREVLVYGITPEFLLSHPELRHADVPTWARLVHEAGGVIFQAHPYRNRWYISTPGPHPDLAYLDGIEVYNAGNAPEENESAALLRERGDLATVAGSDGHSTASAGRAGILSPRRLRTEQDLAALLKARAQKIYIG